MSWVTPCHLCKESLDLRRERYNFVGFFTSPNLESSPTVCMDCYDNVAIHCNDCMGVYIETDFTKKLGGCPYCTKCCALCEQTFQQVDNDEDDTFYDEQTGAIQYVCRDCGISQVIYAYDTDVLDYLEFLGQGPRYLGVELELTISEKKGRTLINYHEGIRLLENSIRGWGLLKKDGSLPPYSVELVSAPASIDIHKQRWEKLLPLVSDYFTGENECCGMHVHISRILEPKLEMKLLSFMHNFENAAWLSNLAGRDIEDDWGREYCPQGGNNWPRRYYAIRGGRVRNPVTDETEHHSAVALAGNTLEFRIFQSSTDYQKVMANIEFVSSLHDYIRTDCSVLRNRYNQFEKWLFSSRGFPNLKKRLLQFKIRKGEKLLSAS